MGWGSQQNSAQKKAPSWGPGKSDGCLFSRGVVVVPQAVGHFSDGQIAHQGVTRSQGLAQAGAMHLLFGGAAVARDGDHVVVGDCAGAATNRHWNVGEISTFRIPPIKKAPEEA